MIRFVFSESDTSCRGEKAGLRRLTGGPLPNSEGVEA